MGKTIYIDVELEKKKVIKQMKNLEKELEKSTNRTKKNNNLTPKIDNKKIKKVLDNIEDSFQKFARDTGVEIDKITFNKLQSEITDTKVKLKLLRQAQREVEKADGPDSTDYKKLDKEIENVSDSLTEAKRRMKNLKNTGDTTTSRLQKKFDKLGIGINKTFSKIGGVVNSAFTAIGGTALVSSLFGSSAEIEQIRTSFNLLIGDTKKAGETMDELANFSSKTPFEFPEIADGGRKLMSVAGIARNDLIPTLTALGDIAASQGKGIDQTVEAFNDAITGEFERLKEFGIKASSSGDKVTFTYKEQETTVSKTKDSIQDYLIALSKVKGVSGSMVEQSKTLNGKISTLKDNFGFLTKAIFGMTSSGNIIEGGVTYHIGNLVSKTVELVTKYQEWGKENPKLASSIGIITAVLGGLAIAIGAVGLASTLLMPGLVAIGAVLSPILVPILGITAGLTALGIAYKENLGGFADKVNELGTLIGTVFLLISDKILLFVNYLKEKFGDEIKSIFNGISEVFSGFINIINIGLEYFNGLFNNSGKEVGIFGNIVKGIFEVIGIIFKNLMSVLEFGLSYIGSLFKVFGKVLQLDFKGAFDGILDIVRSFGTLLKNLFTNTIGGSLDILGNFSKKARKWGENLINSMVDGINGAINKVKEAGGAVANALFRLLGVNSPTKEGPLAVDQSKWGSNLISAIVKGIKKTIPKVIKTVKDVAGELAKLSGIKLKYPQFKKGNKPGDASNFGKLYGQTFIKSLSDSMKSKNKSIQKEAKNIYNELEKINELSLKYKNKKSLSNRIGKLNSKLDIAEYNSDNFKNIKNEIILLKQLQNKYNGQQTEQEKKLYNLKENNFKNNFQQIEKKAKLEDKNTDELLKQFTSRRKAIEDLQKLETNGLEDKQKKEEEINDKIIEYKNEMWNITNKIIDNEKKSIEKLKNNIEKLQKKAKDINNDKDISIAERKLEIEKERKGVLEEISKLDNSGRLGKNTDKIQNINQELEGDLSQRKRNKLLDKKKILLEKINTQILQANNLNGKAYELKKKLVDLEKEEKIVDKNLNGEKLDEVKTEEGKTKTDKILQKYDDEKKAIEETLKLQIEAYKDDEVAYNDVLRNKIVGEENFTDLLKNEINKRIGEQVRLLDNAKNIAAEMAALGFNGKGFTASFKKTDGKTGKTTTVNRTINITNNNKIESNVDYKKMNRKLGNYLARKEASGNIF